MFQKAKCLGLSPNALLFLLIVCLILLLDENNLSNCWKLGVIFINLPTKCSAFRRRMTINNENNNYNWYIA